MVKEKNIKTLDLDVIYGPNLDFGQSLIFKIFIIPAIRVVELILYFLLAFTSITSSDESLIGSC